MGDAENLHLVLTRVLAQRHPLTVIDLRGLRLIASVSMGALLAFKGGVKLQGGVVRLATGAWGWHAEAGLHVLRMIATGVFDRHPGLRLIVGHCGEMVPFMLDRIDVMLRPADLGLKPSECFLRNIWVTTSGLFSLPPVLRTVQVLGVDRVLFSVDYPFGDNAAGRALLDTLPLAPADKARIGGGNAEQVLRLQLPADPSP